MTRFQSTGLDKIIDDMEAMSQDTGELAQRMLFVGAEEIKKAWKKAAEKKNVRLTGQLIESIGYPRKSKKVGSLLSLDIYPQGYSTYTIEKNGKKVMRQIPVRNAEVAFVNHYGTGKRPGTHFVDDADDLSGPMVEEACTKVYDEWLGKHGMK